MKTALEQAVAWYSRLQAPDCRPQERTQFIRWLAASAEHASAYAEVECLSRAMDSQSTHDPRLRAMADAALSEETPAPSALAAFFAASSRRLVPLAAAACMVLSFFIAPLLRDFMAEAPSFVSFSAPTGEQRQLTLNDGSRASLDSDSSLRVQMSKAVRAIELVEGRALFEVAHDAQRPFSVSVGATRVIALGTRFQVQRDAHEVIVTLEEGSVEVVTELDGTTQRQLMQPGEQLRYDADSADWVRAAVETDTVTSWARGRHVFRNTRLGDALLEVNRYAQPKVRLDDPALAELSVSGNFIIGDSALIVSAFAAALPLRMVDSGNELLLVSTQDPDGPQ
ncbi:MAG: hypothetical protein RLZZ227_1402 [Pseudomonadota bacterium]